VFDLDGTLIESRHDLATAVNRVRADLGLAPLGVATILGMVGEGARNLVRRALGGAPEPALLEHALAIFYEHYDEVCTQQTVGFAGIDELLRRLAASRPLAVLTNKPERFARKIIDHLGWGGLFRMVVGGDTFPTRKPDPQGLVAVAARLDVAVGEVMLVGDSRVDAATADAAGCPLVLVAWGFADAAQRQELARRPWAADTEELERFLAP